MTDTPLISVLLPVKEPCPWLHQSVQSILDQTVTDLELILIGSSDEDHWRGQLGDDRRIRYINRPSKGITTALNSGLACAQGEYVARMDSDDISLPHRLEKQLTYSRANPEVGIVGCQVELFNTEQPVGQGSLRYQKWLNQLNEPQEIASNIFVESPLPHPGWLMKREVMHSLNGYRESAWAEDYDFLLRAYLAGLKMGKPAGVLLRWREHQGRLTYNDQRYSRKRFIEAKVWALCQSHLKQKEAHLKNKQAIIVGTGKNAVHLFDALQQQNIKVKCFVDFGPIVNGRTRRHRPVIDYETLRREYDKNDLIISIVSREGAGEKLRQWLNKSYLTENLNFVIAG